MRNIAMTASNLFFRSSSLSSLLSVHFFFFSFVVRVANSAFSQYETVETLIWNRSELLVSSYLGYLQKFINRGGFSWGAQAVQDKNDLIPGFYAPLLPIFSCICFANKISIHFIQIGGVFFSSSFVRKVYVQRWKVALKNGYFGQVELYSCELISRPW